MPLRLRSVRRKSPAPTSNTNESATCVTTNAWFSRWREASPTTAVRRVRLRWNARLDSVRSILGDAWERGYGDLEWRGFVPDRVMIWT